MVELDAAPPPPSMVEAGRCETAASEPERQRPAGRLDGNGPDALLRGAVNGEVATRVDDAWAGNSQQRACPIGDVPLRDTTEVESVSRLDLDSRTVHGDAATTGSPR
jgi:hypothetical protein